MFDDEQVGLILEQAQQLVDELSARRVAVDGPHQRAAMLLARLTAARH